MRNFININDNQELSGQVIGAIKEEIEDVYNLSWEICKLSKFKQKLCIIVHQKILFVLSQHTPSESVMMHRSEPARQRLLQQVSCLPLTLLVLETATKFPALDQSQSH